MRVWVLGSGSKGNAVLLECGESRVLIDAGFAIRDLGQRLEACGVAPSSVQGCILTHEHGDHVRGAAAAAKRWGWELLASDGTRASTPSLAGSAVRSFAPGETVALGGFDVETVPTPHDAVAPCVVVATSRRSGARAGVCYDLGRATDRVRAAMRRLDVLVLEANHDEGMLRAGPYPPSVAGRIAGGHGHLSNRAAAELARESVGPDLRHVVLAHLSESCNDASLARREVSDALRRARFGGAVAVAPQHSVVGPFLPRTARCNPAPQQLGLGL